VAPLGQLPPVGVHPGYVVALDMGSLMVIISQRSTDNCLLKKAKRERDISAEVSLYSNPMSLFVVQRSYRPADW
jgi:hypothetical protein